jgi:amino acid transporter
MKAELERNLGVTSIVFMVIAAAAPITVVAANFPILILESGSIGAPVLIAIAMVILLLFAVGYAWMTPHVPDAGAFYSYVDRGLGRRTGMGTAAIALVSYTLLTVSMACYLGVQTGNLLASWTGVTLPWWAITGAALIVVASLGYRNVDLSAKVLGIVLVLEIVAVVVIDAGVLFSGRELTVAPLNPGEAFQGAPGLGLLFAFLGYFGFEATAVFRKEAKDPEGTIPRATYIAVALIGVLYAVSSWLVIAGLGGHDAVSAASDAPDTVIISLAGEVVAPLMAHIIQVLVVTSMFACMLAFHNIVTRYLFTLGEREVLPVALSTVHPVHSAPSRASLWVTLITAVIAALAALAQLNPVTQIYTWFSGAGAVGVLLMMALASFAVVVFGARLKDLIQKPSLWVTTASLLGGVGLAAVLLLSLWNFPLLVGGTIAAVAAGLFLVLTFLAGFLWSGHEKRASNPAEARSN